MALLIQYLENYNRKWGPIGYAKPGDAGFDLRAAILEPVKIYAGEAALIPCGIKLAIPLGFEVQVRPRSGLALKNQVTVLNSPGTVDSGYRGEVGVILQNHGDFRVFTINPGDRIAQGVLAAVAYLNFMTVDELPDSVRGETGFGSSGVAAFRGAESAAGGAT